jgi:hypothetical protein
MWRPIGDVTYELLDSLRRDQADVAIGDPLPLQRQENPEVDLVDESWESGKDDWIWLRSRPALRLVTSTGEPARSPRPVRIGLWPLHR